MGNIYTHSTAEYNFYSDPESADITLQKMKCPITVSLGEEGLMIREFADCCVGDDVLLPGCF
jgi:hypothetical protein